MTHALPEPALRIRCAPAATIAVVLGLMGVNLANHLLGWNSLWLGPLGAVALIGFARASGLTWAQLGLGRHTHAAGLRWGAIVILLVALIYLVGVVLPGTRAAFLDVRYHLPPASVLLTAFVVIPLGTVLLEEVAFRSVLWGFLAQHARMWQVLLGTSALFGLWHILPATASAADNAAVGTLFVGFGAFATLAAVAGTVLFTALGGIVAGELRRRTGSLFASMGMHWATNALGVLFGLLAWRLAG